MNESGLFTVWLPANVAPLIIGALAGALLAMAALFAVILRLQRQAQHDQQLLAQSRHENAGLNAHLQQMSELKQQLRERDQQLDSLRNKLTLTEARLAEIRARRDADHRHQQAQLALLADGKAQMKQEFSALASEIFEQKQQIFSSQSAQQMTAVLAPFHQQIEQFRQRVDAIHSQDIEGRSQLNAQLVQLQAMNSQLNQQADDLAKALRGDKKLQGNWGELQLERILESAGLKAGREYQREANFKDEHGHNRRPDFIINLPDGKHLIIDSKVSLNAWQQSVAAELDGQREQALREHVQATRSHIRALSEKNYPALQGMQAPDFVLMFMPIESAFVAAFEAAPELFDEAFEQQIVVVTPSTLLATLRTVAQLWSLQRQNENAKELYSLAGKIYDKLSVFTHKMDRLGGQLGAAEKSYKEAMTSLSEGRGSMLSYVAKLKDMGAPVTKSMPASLHSEQSVSSAEQDSADQSV